MEVNSFARENLASKLGVNRKRKLNLRAKREERARPKPKIVTKFSLPSLRGGAGNGFTASHNAGLYEEFEGVDEAMQPPRRAVIVYPSSDKPLPDKDYGNAQQSSQSEIEKSQEHYGSRRDERPCSDTRHYNQHAKMLVSANR